MAILISHLNIFAGKGWSYLHVYTIQLCAYIHVRMWLGGEWTVHTFPTTRCSAEGAGTWLRFPVFGLRWLTLLGAACQVWSGGGDEHPARGRRAPSGCAR